MKTIGIIGGMSWESTLKYYQWLNEGIAAREGGLSSADIVMRSVNFKPVAEMQEAGEWDALGEMLAIDALKLQNSGADFILLATNTMHKVAPQIEAAIQIPFVHLADATAEKIAQSGIKKVGLLATIYTMEQHFYKERLEQRGIEVLIPETDTRKQINNIIFEELCLGKKIPTSRDLFVNASNEMLACGAEGIILGCTEINMLIGQKDFEKPVFDTTRIHIEKALALAIS